MSIYLFALALPVFLLIFCVLTGLVNLFVTESQNDPGYAWFYGGIVCEYVADERLLREAHCQ